MIQVGTVDLQQKCESMHDKSAKRQEMFDIWKAVILKVFGGTKGMSGKAYQFFPEVLLENKIENPCKFHWTKHNENANLLKTV